MSLETELQAACAATRGLFGAAACSCALALDEGAELEFVAADGAGAENIVGVRLPIGRGIAGFVALSGQPIAITDVANDERFARDPYSPTSTAAHCSRCPSSAAAPCGRRCCWRTGSSAAR